MQPAIKGNLYFKFTPKIAGSLIPNKILTNEGNAISATFLSLRCNK